MNVNSLFYQVENWWRRDQKHGNNLLNTIRDNVQNFAMRENVRGLFTG